MAGGFNGSGTYTLPQSAFVPSTPISSSAMNSNLSSIATDGLSLVICKDGQTTITGALKGATGSVGLPSYSFSADLDCGMYRIGANNIGISVNATKILDIATTGLTVVGDTSTSGIATFSATSNMVLPGGTTAQRPASQTAKRFRYNTDLGTVEFDNGVQWIPISSPPSGQCQLTKSGATLILLPYSGNVLTINSAPQTVPDAGITLAVGALSNSTLYYVYAFMNSGTMTLEAVTTVPAVQAGTGIQIKTADATRSLVGLCYLLGGAFIDSATQRYVRSWYNEKPIITINNFTTARSATTSSAFAEVNTEIRNEVILFAGEVWCLSITGGQFNSGAAQTQTSIGVDSTTAAEDTSAYSFNTAVSNAACSINKTGLAVGYHYATLLGNSAGGGATWVGSGAAGTRTVLTGRIDRLLNR